VISRSFRSSNSVRMILMTTATAGALVLSACGSSTPAVTSSTSTTTTAVATAPSSTASGTSTSATDSATGTASASSGPSASVIQPVATATTATADEIAAAKASLIAPGKLTVCTTLQYVPFESSDIDGNIVGFDMDLTKEVAKDLGVTQTVIDTDFTGIKSGQAMASGICDIAAAAMTINPERQAVIQFSDPYYSASQALLVLSDSTIASLADLQGKKIGAQTGTTGQSYADKFASQFGYTVVEYTSITDVEAAVQSRNVDAGIHDDGPLKAFVAQQPDAFKVAASFGTGEQYGLGAKLGNTALIAVTNAMLKREMADGTYKTILEKWIPPTS
jgi:polar amino acid transport system substrate-binding protein